MTNTLTANTTTLQVRRAIHVNTSKVAQYVASLLTAFGNPNLVQVMGGTAPARTMSAADHNQIFSIGANGAAITLPAATGTGVKFRFQLNTALASGKTVVISTA